jgi:hypothetical protein
MESRLDDVGLGKKFKAGIEGSVGSVGLTTMAQNGSYVRISL